jgi:hypothetical protein
MLDTKKLKGFLMAPSETFKASKGDTLGAAFQYYAILLVIWTILAAIVAALMSHIAFQDALIRLSNTGILGGLMAKSLANFSGFVTTMAVTAVYAFFLIALVGVFISGFLWHVFVLLFAGGNKDIVQSIKTVMYASTPFFILGWIPYIAIIGIIWYFVLLILGFAEMDEITIGQSVLVVIVPLILLLILAILGGAVGAALMAGFMGMLPH